MSWKEKIKEFGGGDLAFLSEDGEVIIFIVVGDPVLLKGKFKGNPSEKIGCPIVSSDGFVLLVAGKRLARKISKHEKDFAKTAFMAIRHGEQNDINATYELKVVSDKESVQELRDKYNPKEMPALIDEAVVAALDVMNG